MTFSSSGMSTPSRWVAPVALAVALIAVGIAVWALVRSTDEPAPSPQSAEDNTTGVCEAFDLVQRAVSVRTNANLGPDPVAMEAVAANARLATVAGSEYLLSQLTSGTPSELADEVRGFAHNLVEVGMHQLAGVSGNDPAQAERLAEAQETSLRITELCE